MTKGIADELDIPAGYYAIATEVLEDKSAVDLELSKVNAALEGMLNFTILDPTWQSVRLHPNLIDMKQK